jgi:DNA-binding response OmpR family regulator
MTEPIATVLIADDDPRILQLLRVFLDKAGYEVVLVENGSEAVRLAQDLVPDIILVDVMMPQMDGFEVCRQLRNDTRTSHLPILMLTSRSATQDKIAGLESGADDYVTKPFDLDELLARVRSLLRRATEMPVRNPLTGLSGNRLLREELKHRLERGVPLALLYIDLDNFKAFNDAYGFLRGDEAIQLMGRLVQQTIVQHGAPHDFIGHIGGDDFAVVTDPEYVEPICTGLIQRFDQEIALLYDPEDLERGYLRGYDRHGVPQRFPIMTISIGVVLNRDREFDTLDEISRTAADMKKYAKQKPGSSYAVDQRTMEEPKIVIPERRGRQPVFEISIVGGEPDLLQLLRLRLERLGHHVQTFRSGREFLDQIVERRPGLLILDAMQEQGSVWEFCRTIRSMPSLKHCPIVLLSTDPEDEERAFDLKIDAFLLKPFSMKQFTSHVQDLAGRRCNHRIDQSGVEDE